MAAITHIGALPYRLKTGVQPQEQSRAENAIFAWIKSAKISGCTAEKQIKTFDIPINQNGDAYTDACSAMLDRIVEQAAAEGFRGVKVGSYRVNPVANADAAVAVQTDLFPCSGVAAFRITLTRAFSEIDESIDIQPTGSNTRGVSYREELIDNFRWAGVKTLAIQEALADFVVRLAKVTQSLPTKELEGAADTIAVFLDKTLPSEYQQPHPGPVKETWLKRDKSKNETPIEFAKRVYGRGTSRGVIYNTDPPLYRMIRHQEKNDGYLPPHILPIAGVKKTGFCAAFYGLSETGKALEGSVAQDVLRAYFACHTQKHRARKRLSRPERT